MARPRPTLPAPLTFTVRALGLSVTEVATYWRQERLALRRGLTAVLATSVTGMIAGLTLAAAEDVFDRLPGLLLLIPAAIGMRGAIYGALASRLSTALHVGEYSTELRRASFMGRQIEATTLLTLSTSVIVALLAWVFGALFGLDPIPVWKLVVVASVGGTLSSVFLLIAAIGLSRVAQRRDWNMDDVGSPTVTVMGDVLTVPALLLATLLVEHEVVALVLGLALAAGGFWALVVGWRHSDGIVQRIVRESMVTLGVAAAVWAIAGTVLEIRLEQWVAVPVLLIMIPPFVANCGSLGGILSSRLASKLHLGLIEPRAIPGRMAGLDVSVVFLFGAATFTSIGVVAWTTGTLFGFSPPSVIAIVGLSVIAGVLAVAVLSAVAYAAATASYRFGLDPDNESIPIVTVSMDLFGLLIFVGVAAFLGVG